MVAPPTAALVYSILQLLAYRVNASSRHWQNVLLLEDIRKDAVGKRYVRLICICLIKCLYIQLFYFYKITSMQKRPSPLCEARKSISIENKKSDILKNKRVCYLTGWFLIMNQVHVKIAYNLFPVAVSLCTYAATQTGNVYINRWRCY